MDTIVQLVSEDGTPHPFGEGTFTLGRGQLGISDKKVSRTQASLMIEKIDNEIRVKLTSLGINSSLINETPFAKNESSSLNDGDTLSLCGVIFKVKIAKFPSKSIEKEKEIEVKPPILNESSGDNKWLSSKRKSKALLHEETPQEIKRNEKDNDKEKEKEKEKREEEVKDSEIAKKKLKEQEKELEKENEKDTEKVKAKKKDTEKEKVNEKEGKEKKKSEPKDSSDNSAHSTSDEKHSLIEKSSLGSQDSDSKKKRIITDDSSDDEDALRVYEKENSHPQSAKSEKPLKDPLKMTDEEWIQKLETKPSEVNGKKRKQKEDPSNDVVDDEAFARKLQMEEKRKLAEKENREKKDREMAEKLSQDYDDQEDFEQKTQKKTKYSSSSNKVQKARVVPKRRCNADRVDYQKILELAGLEDIEDESGEEWDGHQNSESMSDGSGEESYHEDDDSSYSEKTQTTDKNKKKSVSVWQGMLQNGC